MSKYQDYGQQADKEIEDLNKRISELNEGNETPTTPPVTPPTTDKLTLTSNEASITLSFPALQAAATAGRDGVDSGGSGAWSETLAAGTTQKVFDKLLPGTTYNVFVGDLKGSIKTKDTIVAPNPTGPGAGGAAWLSGMCGAENARYFDGSIAAWRGETVTACRTWADGTWANQVNARNVPAVYGWQASFAKSGGVLLDLAPGGPGVGGGSPGGWNEAADGKFDQFWTDTCKALAANSTNIPILSLSMAHELSGDWYPWSVKGNNAKFIAAWRRWYGIVKRELKDKGRKTWVTLNYASGRGAVDAIWPGDEYVDVVGLDQYDMWMPQRNVSDQGKWDAWVNSKTGDGSPYGFEAWAQWAQKHGKPFALPEWGLSASKDYKLDNPFWIEACNKFFRSKAPADVMNPGAGKLAFECYFSIPDANTYPSTIYPNESTNPKGAAKYKQLVWGK